MSKTVASFEYRKLSTMLGHLARSMRHSRAAAVSVPIELRDGRHGGCDRFSVEDVELAHLEAERMARVDEGR